MAKSKISSARKKKIKTVLSMMNKQNKRFIPIATPLVEMMDLMAGRELRPDPGLALGNDGEEEAYGVDAIIIEGPGEVLGQLGVEEHDRDDGRVPFPEDEAGDHRKIRPVNEGFRRSVWPWPRSSTRPRGGPSCPSGKKADAKS